MLTTLVQSGAALVAIIAGLLIARLVALASERNGLQRRIIELNQLHALRSKEYEQARRELLDQDGEDFIDDLSDDYLQEQKGFDEWYEAYAENTYHPRSADELRPYFDEFEAKVKRVAELIDFDGLVDHGRPEKWIEVERAKRLRLCRDPREKEIAEQLFNIVEDKWPRERFSYLKVPSVLHNPASIATYKAVNQQISATRYTDLVRSEAAAEAVLKTVELEREHAKNAFETVRRPEGLSVTLGVLFGIALCGIVIPLMHLTFGSPAVSPSLRALYSGLFVLSIAAFFVYLIIEIRRIMMPDQQVTNRPLGRK